MIYQKFVIFISHKRSRVWTRYFTRLCISISSTCVIFLVNLDNFFNVSYLFYCLCDIYEALIDCSCLDHCTCRNPPRRSLQRVVLRYLILVRIRYSDQSVSAPPHERAAHQKPNQSHCFASKNPVGLLEISNQTVVRRRHLSSTLPFRRNLQLLMFQFISRIKKKS